jgi:hypothetical protein
MTSPIFAAILKHVVSRYRNNPFGSGRSHAGIPLGHRLNATPEFVRDLKWFKSIRRVADTRNLPLQQNLTICSLFKLQLVSRMQVQSIAKALGDCDPSIARNFDCHVLSSFGIPYRFLSS